MIGKSDIIEVSLWFPWQLVITKWSQTEDEEGREISMGIIIIHSKTKSLHLFTHTGMKQNKTKRYLSSVVSCQISMSGYAYGTYVTIVSQ